MIVSAGRPSNDQLGQEFDNVRSALSSAAVPGINLQPALDEYLLAEENIKGPDGKNLPESPWVHQARHNRLQADVDYTGAEYAQTPTNENRAEWISAKDTLDKADKLPQTHSSAALPELPPTQSSPSLPDWLNPG